MKPYESATIIGLLLLIYSHLCERGSVLAIIGSLAGVVWMVIAVLRSRSK